MILVLGGGLTGMSTAYHLKRDDPGAEVLVLERENEAGGLCRSQRRDGFTFDFTGHYLHLRDPEMVSWVEEMLGDELIQIERRSSIFMYGKHIPFPFQAHLHGLPKEVNARCLLDFVEASRREEPPRDGVMPFAAWARQVFGDAIAEEFMIPYNSKQMGVSANELTAEWVAWAVPRPKLEQVVRGALGSTNEGLGYNPCFRYPKGGGIGLLPATLAEKCGELISYGEDVLTIDAKRREVKTRGGKTHAYEQLVSTLPLPILLRSIEGLGDEPAELAAKLRANVVLELRLGVERETIADGTHWIYYPERKLPFYRVGFPSNVCSAMAPEGCSSISVEFCQLPGDSVPTADELLERSRPALESAGVLLPNDKIRVCELAVINPGYVIFDAHCTDTVARAMKLLEQNQIRSIGRYGAWTYSYMERALIDGKEAARQLAAVPAGA